MKIFYFIVILILLINCSFDNKTGIWENENKLTKKENKVFKDFQNISSSENNFDEEKSLDPSYIFKISDPIKNFNWKDINYGADNNSKNFIYDNTNKIIFKSKKLTKNKPNDFKLFEDGNLILSDDKGNIIIFSINSETITKFNFYQKKFKKIKKELNFIVDKNVIYVSDNLGYSYAYDYKNKKIIWAKNFKIPFSSNLKMSKNLIIMANQNNDLFFLNRLNGNLLKLIPTEEIALKNNFVNSLSTDENNNLFFLNTFGSLYSINLNSLEINWFNNFNKSFDILPTNLFAGNEIVNDNKKVIVSSGKNTFLIDVNNGAIIKRFNFSSIVKPLIINNYAILITKNDLLIVLNLNSNEILYSYKISDIKKTIMKKNKKNNYSNIIILNNDINIFLENSKVLNFDINGQFKKITDLPNKFYTKPILIENSMLFLNNGKKLVVIN